MVTLALIEDDEVVRTSLAAFFSRQEGVECSIVAVSVEDFLDKSDSAAKPDIILSDIGLPGLTGIEGIPLIKKKFPETSIIILSVYADSDRVFKALCAGAVGYLQKDTPVEEILDDAAADSARAS